MRRFVAGLAIVPMFCFLAILAQAQTTEFTYQGSLKDGANAATGNYDFEFVLFDGGGSQLGGSILRNGVVVTNGIFSVSLDFGNQFPGAGRLLEIRVRPSGGGGFTMLSPRQPVNSTPYSVKSLAADNAVTAANATTAATAGTFIGNLAGDVTGTQVSTTVSRLQGRNVANITPTGGQVLKFNSGTNQWQPDTDLTGSGGGGGTITGVSAGTGLTGGGTTGNVTLGIAPGGVGTGQLAEGSVVDSKIVTVSGGKVVGTVANATNAINATNANTANTATDATNAANATNAQNLGGIPANQYLQANGNGSGLTNLNASNITTGTLANARLGQIPTANIADSAVTSAKIAGGQVTKSVNGLTDNVTLAAGSNISITPSGNTLTIASTGGGGVSGSGIAGQLPVWNGASTLSNSTISQSGGNIGIGTTGAPTDRLTVQSPTDSYGIVHTNGAIAMGTYIGGSTSGGWFGTRSNHPLSFFTNNSSPSITIRRTGEVFIANSAIPGSFPSARLEVIGASGGIPTGSPVGIKSTVSAGDNAIEANSQFGYGVWSTTTSGTGVLGSGSLGVVGNSNSSGGIGVTGDAPFGTGVKGDTQNGVGMLAQGGVPGSIALLSQGSSWFTGNSTPYTLANAGPGTGIAIGSVSGAGFIYGYDHSTNTGKTLAINTPGGNVGIGTFNPDQTLTVNGGASKPGGGSWLAFSDERLKNIKGRFNGGLKAVMKLQPLRYEYKKENLAGVKSEGEHIGFSAQEVEKIIPEAVTKTDKGIRLVNNDPIILAMLNAIKEQQVTIENLSKQVRLLQRSKYHRTVRKLDVRR